MHELDFRNIELAILPGTVTNTCVGDGLLVLMELCKKIPKIPESDSRLASVLSDKEEIYQEAYRYRETILCFLVAIDD